MNTIIQYKGEEYVVSTTPYNIHIENSFKIKKTSDMKNVISLIRQESAPTDLIYSLSETSMIREWKAHNLLYALGLFRSHTESVDLNENKWYVRFAYTLISWFYWK